jgi:hypothetical protein
MRWSCSTCRYVLRLAALGSHWRAFCRTSYQGPALLLAQCTTQSVDPCVVHCVRVQDAQQAQGFALERLQERAVQIGSDAAAMPTRIAAMDR